MRLNEPRRHLRSHLAMQKLSSEATTSCPNREAPGLSEHDQRVVSLTEWLTAGGPYNQSVAEKNLVRRDWLLDFTCITWSCYNTAATIGWLSMT